MMLLEYETFRSEREYLILIPIWYITETKLELQIWKLGIYGRFGEEQGFESRHRGEFMPTLNEFMKKNFESRESHAKNKFHEFSFIFINFSNPTYEMYL